MGDHHRERLRRIVDQQLGLLEQMSVRGQFPSPQSAESVRILLAASEHESADCEAKRLREAIVEALRWHVYSVDADDPDGNLVRIEKVDRILREALGRA